MSDLEHDAYERGNTTPPAARPENILGAIDTTDRRPIEKAPFGMEAPEAEREDVARRVRGILAMCDVKIVDDINRLGCTGLTKIWTAHAEEQWNPGIDGLPVNLFGCGQFLRLGLAGCGTGLPCFVPPTRFCLIHNTIGGLMENQAALHPEFVETVSRELTDTERATVGLREKARHMRGKERDLDAQELLSGRRLDDVHEVIEGVTGGPDVEEEEDRRPIEVRPREVTVTPWKCEEHTTTVWSCRHCLAQAIVEGPLEPAFITFTLKDGGSDADIVVQNPTQLETFLARRDVRAVHVYAQVASFTRKLARD